MKTNTRKCPKCSVVAVQDDGYCAAYCREQTLPVISYKEIMPPKVTAAIVSERKYQEKKCVNATVQAVTANLPGNS